MYALRIAICVHGIRKVELVMRIISQNGLLDVPYELIAISPYSGNMETIVGTFPGNDSGKGDRVYILGKYSTEEKAIKAMEMCRKHYATAEYNRRIIPKGDTLVDMEIAKELLASGFIFQFPAEEEV